MDILCFCIEINILEIIYAVLENRTLPFLFTSETYFTMTKKFFFINNYCQSIKEQSKIEAESVEFCWSVICQINVKIIQSNRLSQVVYVDL